MKPSSHPHPFHIALTLTGTLSAGAYTAGVLDYLLEAFERWEQARNAGRADVPAHRLVIDVMGGASGGAINAALAVRALHEPRVCSITPCHRDDPAVLQANPFYRSWVQMTGDELIREMLSPDADELRSGRIRSLFNAQFIDRLAGDMLTGPGGTIHQPYIARDLELLFTLSNLTGYPRSIPFGNNTAQMRRHLDAAHFRLPDGGEPVEGIMPLDMGSGRDLARLRSALKATSAFPLVLPHRTVERPEHAVLDNPLFHAWSWLDGPPEEARSSAVVDGGLLNSDPYLLVEKRMRSRGVCLDPEPAPATDVATGAETDATTDPAAAPRDGFVNGTNILIDALPFDEDPPGSRSDPGDLHAGHIAGRTLLAMRNQLRYKPGPFDQVDDTYDIRRFTISPSGCPNGGAPAIGKQALASGRLWAFAGFLKTSFRRYDFYLGRRNCQRFLQRQFLVPESVLLANPCFAGYGRQAMAQWAVPRQGERFYPILPDVGVLTEAGGAHKEAVAGTKGHKNGREAGFTCPAGSACPPEEPCLNGQARFPVFCEQDLQGVLTAAGHRLDSLHRAMIRGLGFPVRLWLWMGWTGVFGIGNGIKARLLRQLEGRLKKELM